MNDFDSQPHFVERLLALILVVALSGCSQTTTSGYAPDIAFAASVTHEDEAAAPASVLSRFQDICLRPTLAPIEAKALALRLGWKEADQTTLEQAGLKRLRKKVLEIPGGGARFREEQEIVVHPGATNEDQAENPPLAVAAFERRITGNETRSISCAVYFRSDFLKTCEALGRLINRAPDRNQIYPQRDAHFIQWTIRLDGKEAVLNCSRAPQSALLAYDGTTLSVSADHSGTARKSAFRKIQPVQAAFKSADR